ncbi:MAG: hypothetical protein MJK04_37705, partial [Psychrosphaera sp.]|nr:hypothetical protein [Psychrosphaera sp.]
HYVPATHLKAISHGGVKKSHGGHGGKKKEKQTQCNSCPILLLFPSFPSLSFLRGHRDSFLPLRVNRFSGA